MLILLFSGNIASQAAGGLFEAQVRYRRAVASEKLGDLTQALEARTRG